MSRLIDADELIEKIEEYCDELYEMSVCDYLNLICKAPTVSTNGWYYPSKGEYPDDKSGLFLICLKESYRGVPHIEVASGWTGSSFLSQDAKEYWLDEIRAWKYIVPPKEEA